MRAITISEKGQVAIPAEIRKTLNIKAGDQFTVEVTGNNIVLKPAMTITIPRDQAYFWTAEVQKTIKNAEDGFQKGKSKSYPVDDFIKELGKRDKG